MSRSFAIITLGCKLNFSESSTIAREFESHGYIRTAYTKAADLYIVNSCSVTEHADKKCRQHIRQLHRINPEAVIVVTGCFAQLKSKEVSEIEGVSIVVGIE
ncbi:MAG: tRNA (N(6)-L-threonylcarbamoyladenosine(37)-C(2))-methylthiotransferase MtaB, partial [Bacteroidales bacterium]|nr:tRNA (N(6)-L-threonylcarbamoyladenosine(37)-C(2))-methylthiotransferase MtaB [Candidatus Egerieousia equi]